jgi:flagellar motility protein MotE (MotC chaperone)
MSSLAKELKERAERLFQQKHLGKALHDYRAKEEAIRLLTAKLRAERLAHEDPSRIKKEGPAFPARGPLALAKVSPSG